MPMGSRPKPPAERREDLLSAVRKALAEQMEPIEAVDYLLPFFTNIDLVGIRDELRKHATTEKLRKETGRG